MVEKMIRWDEINPRTMVGVALKNLWIVVALCISVLCCYNAVNELTYTPKFTSSATFMVSARDSTSAYNSLTTTQSMASVFVEVFQSNVLREKIQEQMGEETFNGTINTVTIPETNLLIVSVTALSPDMAFRGLNLIVENYSSISDYLFSNAQLEVIKDPVVPISPVNPLNIRKNIPLIVAVTAVVSLLLVCVVWLLRDTLQTPKAVRRKIDARLLRTIHHEEKNKTLRAKWLRKNSAPLITNALITKRFIEDNLSLCSTLEYHMRKRGQKVVMVTSIGENEGKSTVVANLALSLAQKEKRVVLLDCDFRKPSMHKIFEASVEAGANLTDYLLAEQEDPAPYLTVLKKQGITIGFSKNAYNSIPELIHNGKFARLLMFLRENVDYVILDTPPMLAAADAEAFSAMADTTVMVLRTDYMSTNSINDGLERLRKAAPEVCGVVLNNYRS